jgi:hypothetical protein
VKQDFVVNLDLIGAQLDSTPKSITICSATLLRPIATHDFPNTTKFFPAQVNVRYTFREPHKRLARVFGKNRQ